MTPHADAWRCPHTTTHTCPACEGIKEEHGDPTGQLVGNCLSARNERVLYVDVREVLGPVGVAELIVKAAAEEGQP